MTSSLFVRSSTTTVTVLCSQQLIDILLPVKRSAVVPYYTEGVVAAVYDLDFLAAISESALERQGAWWREMGSCAIDIPWQPRNIRKAGVWGYLSSLGISTERNLAAALHDMARNAGMTEIELMNWLVQKLRKTKAS